jgi:hypothetical protein
LILVNNKGAVSNQKSTFWFDRPLLFHLGIEFTLRNNPSNPCWRGKSIQITVGKPAKASLAGKNVRGQHEIPRQNHFDGEVRYERNPQTIQSCHQTKKNGTASIFETVPFRFSLLVFVWVVFCILVGRVDGSWQVVRACINRIQFERFVPNIGDVVPFVGRDKDSVIVGNFLFEVQIVL